MREATTKRSRRLKFSARAEGETSKEATETCAVGGAKKSAWHFVGEGQSRGAELRVRFLRGLRWARQGCVGRRPAPRAGGWPGVSRGREILMVGKRGMMRWALLRKKVGICLDISYLLIIYNKSF